MVVSVVQFKQCLEIFLTQNSMIVTQQLVNEAYMLTYIEWYIFWGTTDLEAVNRRRAELWLSKEYRLQYPCQSEILKLIPLWVRGKYKLKMKTLKELLQGKWMRARVGGNSDIHGYSVGDLYEIMQEYLIITKQDAK